MKVLIDERTSDAIAEWLPDACSPGSASPAREIRRKSVTLTYPHEKPELSDGLPQR